MMDPKVIRAWGQIVVSVYALSALVAVAIFAFVKGIESLELMIVGAIVGYAAHCVSFYYGDSSSGQTKDDIIAASNPPPPKPGSAT